MEMLDCPILESFGNLDARKEMVDLFFKLISAHASLCAGAILAFGTMVIGVEEIVGILHLFNRSLTTRAGGFAPVGELETAVSANELVLRFGGDHAFAFTATDEPCEREHPVRLGARTAFAAQEHLDAVEFCLCHHRLMFAFVPSAAFLWVFKRAVVKRYCEHLVNGTPG